MADTDTTTEAMNEEPVHTEETADQGTSVESSQAADVRDRQTGNEVNCRNDRDQNSDSELFHGDAEETWMGDAEDLEIDEDDITSKLLSIQVLPRIPKRKRVIDDNAMTSVGETSSNCSVLERVNSNACSLAAGCTNWSAAGWSRSNIDQPPKRWSQKNVRDRKEESKPVKRTMAEKYPVNDAKHKPEVTANKAKPAADYSAWLPTATDVSEPTAFSDMEQTAADEGTASPLTGPLPTLPFEEQMRERAKLRNLKKQGGFDVSNSSSDAKEMTPKNANSRDNSKDCFDMSNAPGFQLDKSDTSKSVVSHGQQDDKMTSRANSSAPVHTNPSERHRSSHRHPSENGHSHDHKSNKQHRTNRTSTDKTNHLHLNRISGATPAKSSGDEPIPKSKKESGSPPLPHLPVLPLFATSASETSDSFFNPAETRTGNKSAPLSSSSRSSHAANALNISKPKPPTSATAPAVTKSVTFKVNPELQGASQAKKKTKPKFQYEDKHTMQQCVIEEMKVFLKPYYARRRITKEQYKEIMRSSVTRICRGCPPAGEISASRVRKYAEAYLDKALQLNVGKSSMRQDKAAS